MLRICILLVWLISSSVIYKVHVKPVFGVKITIGANSQITSFVCYLNNGRVLTQKKIMDRDTFVKIVSGFWPSIYNPQRKNLFEENNIDCGLITDTVTYKKVVSCFPVDSLWKIRFSTYPFQHNSEKGWSNKYHRPSHSQEKYIHERYGVSQIDGEYFLDTNFWLLMHDVIDTSWIANYKTLK